MPENIQYYNHIVGRPTLQVVRLISIVTPAYHPHQKHRYIFIISKWLIIPKKKKKARKTYSYNKIYNSYFLI